MTVETHDRERAIAERHGLSVYNAMIAAAAPLADCNVLYSEDMQDGLLLDEQLRIPIRSRSAADAPGVSFYRKRGH